MRKGKADGECGRERKGEKWQRFSERLLSEMNDGIERKLRKRWSENVRER